MDPGGVVYVPGASLEKLEPMKMDQCKQLFLLKEQVSIELAAVTCRKHPCVGGGRGSIFIVCMYMCIRSCITYIYRTP